MESLCTLSRYRSLRVIAPETQRIGVESGDLDATLTRVYDALIPWCIPQTFTSMYS